MGDFIDGVQDFAGDTLGIGESSAEQAAKESRDLYNKIQLPELADVTLKRLSEVGDPRDFVKRLKDTELKGIQLSPELKAAQFGALTKLQEISNAGGLTEGDKARMQEIAREEARREQGQREALTQSAQRRGVGGSGFELASLLSNEQGSAERSAARNLSVQQQAQQRALDALLSSANLAGSVRGQEFGEKRDVASAQDLINKFNTSALTDAGMRAFENKQAIANQNVGLTNQQRLLNQVELPQQRFGNQLTLTGAQAGAIQNVGAAKGARNQMLGDRITQAATMAAGLPPMSMPGGGARMSGTASVPEQLPDIKLQYPGPSYR